MKFTSDYRRRPETARYPQRHPKAVAYSFGRPEIDLAGLPLAKPAIGSADVEWSSRRRQSNLPHQSVSFPGFAPVRKPRVRLPGAIQLIPKSDGVLARLSRCCAIIPEQPPATRAARPLASHCLGGEPGHLVPSVYAGWQGRRTRGPSGDALPKAPEKPLHHSAE